MKLSNKTGSYLLKISRKYKLSKILLNATQISSTNVLLNLCCQTVLYSPLSLLKSEKHARVFFTFVAWLINFSKSLAFNQYLFLLIEDSYKLKNRINNFTKKNIPWINETSHWRGLRGTRLQKTNLRLWSHFWWLDEKIITINLWIVKFI